jgi:hypothetical protein
MLWTLFYPLCDGCSGTTNATLTAENEDEIAQFCEECDHKAIEAIKAIGRIPPGMRIELTDRPALNDGDELVRRRGLTTLEEIARDIQLDQRG